MSSDPRSVANIGTDMTFAKAKVMRYPAEVIIDAAHKSMSLKGEFSDSFKSTNAISMPGVGKTAQPFCRTTGLLGP